MAVTNYPSLSAGSCLPETRTQEPGRHAPQRNRSTIILEPKLAKSMHETNDYLGMHSSAFT
jgi:hypothetical protein